MESDCASVLSRLGITFMESSRTAFYSAGIVVHPPPFDEASHQNNFSCSETLQSLKPYLFQAAITILFKKKKLQGHFLAIGARLEVSSVETFTPNGYIWITCFTTGRYSKETQSTSLYCILCFIHSMCGVFVFAALSKSKYPCVYGSSLKKTWD